jgi:acylphosphatase
MVAPMFPHKTLSFHARVTRRNADHAIVPLPFDPAEAWGMRDRYHVTGTIEGVGFRTVLEHEGGWRIGLGRKSPSAIGLQDGQSVLVVVQPEGPQADELASDIAEALAARPRAKAAFEALATFYRKGWLRWIDATKRRPDVRTARIAEMVNLVAEGHKQRPS